MNKRLLSLLFLVAAPTLAQTPGSYDATTPSLPVYQATPATSTTYVAAPARLRWFSLGLGPMALVDTARDQPGPLMVGANLRARFRSRGRFGFEAAIGYLQGGGSHVMRVQPVDGSTAGSDPSTPTAPPASGPTLDVKRQLVPISASALLHIFPNDDGRIFNLFFLGGAGVMFDWVSSHDAAGGGSQLNLTSYEGHLGVGSELRFHWFAVEADIRALGILRGSGTNQPDPLLAPATIAVQTSINAVIWF